MLKWLSQATPGVSDIGRYRHAFDITRGLEGTGVCGTYEVVTFENRPVLVCEDIGGVALREILGEGRQEVSWTLNVAAAVADALVSIHASGLVHKDINPANVVVNRTDGRIQVIDFDIASRLLRETQDDWSAAALQGTLAYISPEQTGRMNRSIDHRTDLYALGVTLYQMLTGHVPFEHTDPISLVHHHIAVVPPSPFTIDPEIPEPVSLLVMRLLAKTPEDRYQTAAGVRADLRRCIDALETSGAVPPFQLATHDLSPQLRVSQRLYGRDVHRAPEAVAPLAGAIFSRTHGNPFFVDRLLTTLYEEGALSLDTDAGVWEWDLERVQAIGVSENVADLMARRIHGLPEGTRRVLQLAACVGNSFDLETLSTVCEMGVGDLAQELWPAVGAELVRPEGHAYQFVGVPGQSAAEVRYRFAHDRVQEAAYLGGPARSRRPRPRPARSTSWTSGPC